MILDLGLPDLDGVEIIKKTRAWSQMPIIVVSSRSDDADKIDALDAGADDYLTKPFSVDELLARIRVALRRVQFMQDHGSAGESVFENGGLKIDFAAGCVYVAGEEIHLSPIEYKLLCLLAHNVGKVLTHNMILKEVWQNTLPNDTPSLRVYMATLRKKSRASAGAEAHSNARRYRVSHDADIGRAMISESKQAYFLRCSLPCDSRGGTSS